MRLLGAAHAMFVPQRPLAAPGGALWQQLCYPDGGGSGGSTAVGGAAAGGHRLAAGAAPRPADAQLLALLQRVGLSHLLARVGGSLDAPANWGAMLSPGELQRLAVARVLLRLVRGLGAGLAGSWGLKSMRRWWRASEAGHVSLHCRCRPPPPAPAGALRWRCLTR